MRHPISYKSASVALAAISMFLFYNWTATAETTPSLPLENLAIPESLGKVQERFVGSGNRIIIQIQDVHAHAAAQENIAAILEHLQIVGRIDKVALEGAWITTDLPKSHALPTSREKQLLARSLLSDDLISGPVYASLIAPSPLMLMGMEDAELYEKNRDLFIKHLEAAPAIDSKVRAYGERLQNLQKQAWNQDLLTFGIAFSKFEEAMDYGKFFPFLIEISGSHNVDFSDLAQIVLTRDIMAFEKSISKERLEKEAKQLMRQFKDTPWTLEELIRGNKIPSEQLGFYPEIKKLLHLFKLRDRVSLTELMSQTETLISRILKMLIQTPEEEALWGKSERFFLAKRILLLKAAPDDLKTYEDEKAALEADLQEAGLSEGLDLSLKFYEVVKKRDEIFYDKIVNGPAFAGPLAVVTGGFHTDGLSKKFRAAGISYITIAPELGNTSMDEKLYVERMRSSKPAQYQDLPPLADPGIAEGKTETLSELRNAIAWIDERFFEAYEVLMQTKDVRKAVAAFSGTTVTISNAQKISYAYSAGKVVSARKTGGTTIPAIHEAEFLASTRQEQLAVVQGWLDKAPRVDQKAMLVSSVSVLKKLLSDEKVPGLIEKITKNGDLLVLLQDIPLTEVPESLMTARGIDRFDAPDFQHLLQNMPRFQRLAKKYPFAIMKEGYRSQAYVVLPEDPASLILYRIVTLSPSLYQAAKNPRFLNLLKELVAEILSEELPKKSV
ncbi:MAG TPA: hypothetical protein PLO78_07770 [Candidatus Omnitrophota bacterium]|nr:hypothetical protein [Candidatus Omnitrophota bacterium]